MQAEDSAATRLIALLGALAYYNDKGFEHARHDLRRVAEARAKALLEMEGLVAEIGPSRLPPAFLQALSAGEVDADASGRYQSLVARHVRLSSPC